MGGVRRVERGRGNREAVGGRVQEAVVCIHTIILIVTRIPFTSNSDHERVMWHVRAEFVGMDV